ncbi:SRPBCC domain-containing protein [Desulfovibrio sp. TomC]|uniref:SRPBCC domain-containing protein n=1 Tax=Desulfovibrio sp. TomC TaxID=1562888 RepID=UPI000575AC60|nr:SRPBCC domain-containing protein [Desulfovibrio sp. TomC]KHK02390.1 Transcriptional regulator, ArsR family [Desulfovibrio sp. TomC]
MRPDGPRHSYELYIRASAGAVWAVLTDDAKTPLYQHFNMRSQSEFRVGGAVSWLMGEMTAVAGVIEEFVPPARMVMRFRALWSPEVAADKPSRVTWELTPLAENACRLRLIHDDFGGETATAATVTDGWPEALSRLKTLVETGEPFFLPARG